MSANENDKAQIDKILEELAEPHAFDLAEQRILAIAPQLHKTLDAALNAGGWFDKAHEGAVLKTATTPDEEARIAAVSALVLEQTRLGMLVGVAVGWEIAERLAELEPEPASAEPVGSMGENQDPPREDRPMPEATYGPVE